MLPGKITISLYPYYIACQLRSFTTADIQDEDAVK
jgi:hypothetical protein